MADIPVMPGGGVGSMCRFASNGRFCGIDHQLLVFFIEIITINLEVP